MKHKILSALTIFLVFSFAFIASAQIGQPPAIVWQKTIGGNGTDSMSAFCIGKNKSIIMCGVSNSSISGNKLQSAVGGYDYWVVKTDSLGNIVWSKTLGGSNDDIASAIIATSDGGYLVGGSSISDASGSKTGNSFGFSNDYWVLKMDANGNTQWNATLGGYYNDLLTSLIELPNGNFVAGGSSYSDSDNVKTSKDIGPESSADYWAVTLNSSGTAVSQGYTGGTSDDQLATVLPRGKDELFMVGSSYSNKNPGYKAQNPFGNNDYWVVLADLNGNIQSDAEFGGNRSNYLTSSQVLPDSSLILGGYSNSDSGFSKTEPFLGVTDYWVIKLKTNSTKQWDRTLGGSGGDYLVSVQQTKDKGFLLGGYSNSNRSITKLEDSKGGNDYWIVKLDKQGREIWNKTIGGSGNDILAGAYETDSNQYVIAGTSFSPQSGDKDAASSGSDYWVLHLSGDQTVLPVTLVSFTAQIQQQNVLLNWSVANATNISRFETERSTDGNNFTSTDVVTALSTSSNTYQSTDVKATLLPFSRLYYRLKIFNTDGSFTYSNVITVQLLSLVSVDFIILPNPVKSTLTLQYHTAANEKANVVVYTASGKVILTATLPSAESISTHSFGVAGLAKGVYYVSMNTGNKDKKVTKAFVKD